MYVHTLICHHSQCVELFATMVDKVHAVDPLQYVLTLLADLTDDERNVLLLVKTAEGSVRLCRTVCVCVCLCLCVCVCVCVGGCVSMSVLVYFLLSRDQLYRPLLGVFHKNDKDKYSRHQVICNIHTLIHTYV